MEGSHVIEVDEAEFEDRVLAASEHRPVVVDFWAGWCRPCLVLGPVLERLAEEHGGRFTLAKLDVDANPELAARYGIQGIPAVKAFRDGQVVLEFTGAQPEEVVRRFLDQVVPSEADDLVAEARLVGSASDAEALYRRARELDPDHPEAVVGLADILVDREEVDEARALLLRVPGDPRAASLRAGLELQAAAADGSPVAAAARAAAEGDHRTALDRLLALISEGGDERDPAREAILQIFQVLGNDHPLIREFRPRLARALF
ncbi:MAG: tetratricopeptide repeat protein [Actinomycetota bacterium]